MSDLSRDLRAASDALRRDLDALAALEDQKRSVALDDPRARDLARQVEEVAARVLARTATQTALTEAAVASGTVGSIATTRRPPAEILNEWRELERRASEAEPGSAEAEEVAVLLRGIRGEYHAAFEASKIKERPEG